MNTIATVILIGSMLFSNMANAVTFTRTETTFLNGEQVRRETTVTNWRGEVIEHYVAVPFSVHSQTTEP